MGTQNPSIGGQISPAPHSSVLVQLVKSAKRTNELHGHSILIEMNIKIENRAKNLSHPYIDSLSYSAILPGGEQNWSAHLEFPGRTAQSESLWQPRPHTRGPPASTGWALQTRLGTLRRKRPGGEGQSVSEVQGIRQIFFTHVLPEGHGGPSAWQGLGRPEITRDVSGMLDVDF